MNKVFLIDGASGTGKSDLIRFVKDNLDNYDINIIRKNTSRALRKTEEAHDIDYELSFFSEEEFHSRGFDDKSKYWTYKYGGKQYSFSKEELKCSAMNHEFTFVIVRDKLLIKNIQKDLSNIALTFYLYLYTDEERVRSRLKDEGFSDDVIERRIERNRTAWDDYLTTPDDEIIVIINTSNQMDFHKKIKLLIDKYSNRYESNEILYLTPNDKLTLPQPLVGFKRQMVDALAKYPYEKNIFLMMKYRSENEEYYTRITELLNNAGYNCVRADSSEWNLTRETHNYIAVSLCCKYGIALFDEPEIKMIKGKRSQIDYNPNVAYEIGMMQAYNKNCLILKHESLSDTPFDLVKDLLVKYKGLDLLSKVESWLKSI